jgi:hypothetical protein
VTSKIISTAAPEDGNGAKRSPERQTLLPSERPIIWAPYEKGQGSSYGSLRQCSHEDPLALFFAKLKDEPVPWRAELCAQIAERRHDPLEATEVRFLASIALLSPYWTDRDQDDESVVIDAEGVPSNSRTFAQLLVSQDFPTEDERLSRRAVKEREQAKVRFFACATHAVQAVTSRLKFLPTEDGVTIPWARKKGLSSVYRRPLALHLHNSFDSFLFMVWVHERLPQINRTAYREFVRAQKLVRTLDRKVAKIEVGLSAAEEILRAAQAGIEAAFEQGGDA